MQAQTTNKIHCTSCCNTKQDFQTCPQKHYCSDKQVFTTYAVKNRMKCPCCISCPQCLYKLNTKDYLDGKQFFFYACNNCGYTTQTFDFLLQKKDDVRDKEDYNKLLKKKVPDALKMNDFENLFRSILDKTYSEVKDQVEFQTEADKVRNSITTFFKIEKKDATVEPRDQSLTMEDFGISEYPDDHERKVQESEMYDINVLESNLHGIQTVDKEYQNTCKQKNVFDLNDFSCLNTQMRFAPNNLIHTNKYLRPLKPNQEVFIIKHENPLDGTLISCNNDDRSQVFQKNVPQVKLSQIKKKNMDTFDVWIKIKSHNSTENTSFNVLPLNTEEFNYSKSVDDEQQMNGQLSFLQRKPMFKIGKVAKDNLLKHNMSLSQQSEIDKANGIEKRNFSQVVLRGTLVHRDSNQSIVFGLTVENNDKRTKQEILLKHMIDFTE